jgi:hypothetical protein
MPLSTVDVAGGGSVAVLSLPLLEQPASASIARHKTAIIKYFIFIAISFSISAAYHPDARSQCDFSK